MNNYKFFLSVFLLIINTSLSGLVHISPGIADYLGGNFPLIFFFMIFLISYIAVCYLGWHIYKSFAEHLDPSGQCITGFILPFICAFIATLNWSAFSILSGVTADAPDAYLGRFDFYSLMMIFIIFIVGGLTWGVFMKTPEYDDKAQENVAVGFTVLSYWFGFIVFCWGWLILDNLIS